MQSLCRKGRGHRPDHSDLTSEYNYSAFLGVANPDLPISDPDPSFSFGRSEKLGIQSNPSVVDWARRARIRP